MPEPPRFLKDTTYSIPSEARLKALWAFSRTQKSSNPDGYASNVRWWSGAIGAALPTGSLGDTLVIKLDGSLLDALERDGVRPKGIAGVIDATPSQFMPRAQFMDSLTPLEASPSIASRVVNLGWSALSRLSPFGGGEVTEEALWKRLSGKEFVHLPRVKAAAETIGKHLIDNPPINYTDSLHTRSSFVKEFGSVLGGITKNDVDVLLRYLDRDVGIVSVDGDVIKILHDGEHGITEADRGALSVVSTLSRVEAQIASIEEESAACQSKAKAKISQGQRTVAASYLRSKKNLDDVLLKRVATGEQLRNVIRALDQAKGDAAVMSAYEASTAALATALADPRLSPDRIAATTDALADALADQKEIDDAVMMGGKMAAPDVDEDELEAELAALVLEEKEEMAKREKAAKEEQIRKEKAELERREREDKERKEREEREKREKEAKAEAVKLASLQAPSTAEWAERHEDAQERERQERLRAEAERLAKENRVAAE